MGRNNRDNMEDMRALCKTECVGEASHPPAPCETFKLLLERCVTINTLEGGREVHAQIIKSSLEADVSAGNALVNMYIKCGSLDDASQTFSVLNGGNIVLWNAIISGYCQCGLFKQAVHYFWKMGRAGLGPNDVTFLNTLKACAAMGMFDQASHVHSELVRSGIPMNDFLANTLVDMYAKCGSLADACRTFEQMVVRTVSSWNVIISGYCQYKQYDKVFELFRKMILIGLQPNNYTLVTLLRTCGDAEDLIWGKHVHGLVIRHEFETHVFVANSLITLYAKCGCTQDAQGVFDAMPEKDLISWNAMIGGYILNERNVQALELFRRLLGDGLKPDRATFISCLKACVNVHAFDIGKKIHACCVELEYTGCILLSSTLVDMYAKCNGIDDARNIFDKMPKQGVVVWNTLIGGYSHNRKEAFKLFTQMQEDSVEHDDVTLLSLLKACNSQEDLESCYLIHGSCIEHGCESGLFVGSTLLDLYTTCGHFEDAWGVFEVMPERSVISWNAMVGGLADHGHGGDAMELVQQMEMEGVQQDETTYVFALNACAELADLQQGRRIHGRLFFSIKQLDICTGNALVDMYGKCGSPVEALKAFNSMSEWDVVSWNALISGYAQHGHGELALQFAQDMQQQGVIFNHITVVGIMNACSHAGLIAEARGFFDAIHEAYGISPTQEHYACMVDVYGRAGLLGEAERFIRKIPMEPSSVIWMALLGACRTYHSNELALFAAKHILHLEPENSAAFLLVSKLSGATDRWEEDIDLEDM